MITVAFYDTKEYDKPSFEHYGRLHDIRFRFLETKLNEDTVDLAKGCDAVCVFVNDTVNDAVIGRLHAYGVRLIALRSAGYNNVDLQSAFGKIHVVRVPAYSPYAVAEHAIALLLTGKRAVLIFGAVGIFIAYFCLNADKPSKRIVKIIGVVILIVLLFFIARTFIPALDNFINRFIETSERGDITTGRGELSSVAVRFFAENPIIGIGWDHYKYYYLAVYNKLLNAHNVFLQLLAENGILGAAPFFGLFVLLYVRAIRALLRYVKTEAEKDPACTLALTLSISMQTMFLLYCLTGNPLYDSQMLIPYLCSCAMGEYYILRKKKKREG